MRYYRKALFLWCLIVVLFVAGVLTLYPIHAEYCQESGNPPTKRCASYHVALVTIWKIGEALHHYHGLLTALSTFAIAAFTWTLWRATSGLLETARIQSADMKASIATAQQSADAARVAAVAATMSAELSEKSFEHTVVRTQSLDRAYIAFSPARFVSGGMQFTIDNIGRTPAMLSFISAEFRQEEPIALGEHEPLPTSFKQTIRLDSFIGGQKSGYLINITFSIPQDANWVMAAIEYKDIFRSVHRTWICAHINPREGRWRIAGPSRNTYT
jgi:hypothetical protein